MNIASDSPAFDDSSSSSSLIPSNALYAASTLAAKRTRAEQRVRRAPRLSANLWQHTQSELAAEQRYNCLLRGVFGALGILSAGTVVYAAWQTVAVMSGSHFQDAVAAFLR